MKNKDIEKKYETPQLQKASKNLRNRAKRFRQGRMTAKTFYKSIREL